MKKVSPQEEPAINYKLLSINAFYYACYTVLSEEGGGRLVWCDSLTSATRYKQ